MVELLTDPTRCQVMLVTLPEETPVNELVETAFAIEDRAGVALGPDRRERVPARGRRPERRSRAGRCRRGARRRRVRRHRARRLRGGSTRGRGRVPHRRRGLVSRSSGPGWPPCSRFPRSSCRSCSPPMSVRPRSTSSPTRSRRVSRRWIPSRDDASPISSTRCHVIVCCGTGGVGKTTTAATLAIEGARRGRDAVVVTIDPAKRLANTLGLEHLSNTPHEIAAVALATATTIPRCTAGCTRSCSTRSRRSTSSSRSTRRTRSRSSASSTNGFYRNIAGALSGTQEYMAMEKLYELHAVGQVRPHRRRHPSHPPRPRLPRRAPPAHPSARQPDLPAADGTDPHHLPRHQRRGTGVRAHGRARRGTEVIDDVIAFFRAFEGMEAGFRDRADQVMKLLGAPETSFVLVTTPRRDAVEEGEYFADRLTEHGMAVEALIVNRVHPHYGLDAPEPLRAAGHRARQRARRGRAASRRPVREPRRPGAGGRARASRAGRTRRAPGQRRGRARARARSRRVRLLRAPCGREASGRLTAPAGFIVPLFC